MRAAAASRADMAARRLLVAGAAAGPLYILTALVQILIREGFDSRLHAVSLLSNGELGWIQVRNFVAAGFLVLAGALGMRKALRARPGGLWGPCRSANTTR